MQNCLKLAVIVLSLGLAACTQSGSTKPELAYLVAYAILDERFHTSTRLDITADIYNPASAPIELVQLTLTDTAGVNYVLDYQTVGQYAQEGRYNAVPLPKPIENMEICGAKGEEYMSPANMHFLFVTSFQKAVIKFRDSAGVQEQEIKNIEEVLQKSRTETIAWMKKEQEEREKILAELQAKANEKIAKNRANKPDPQQ